MRKILANKNYRYIFSMIMVVIGGLIIGMSFKMFYTPNEITPGGFMGLSTIISNWIGGALSTAIIYAFINVVLFLLTTKFLGVKFAILTLLGVTVTTLTTQFVPNIYLTDDKLLASFLGGAMNGLGLGLAFWVGGSTGGSDFVAVLVNKFFPKVKNGQCSFAINAIVIILSMVTFGIHLSLYAIIAVFICGQTCDMVLNGSKSLRAFYIICDNDKEVSEVILQAFHRGVTRIEAQGAFSNKEKKMLLCLVSNQQAPLMKSLVKEADPNSFVFSTTVFETMGEGFFAREASVRKNKIKTAHSTLKNQTCKYSRKAQIKKTKFKLCHRNRLKAKK